MGVAPEKKQAFGQRSKESLSELAYGQTAIVDSEKIDKWGREIGKVTVNGRDVSLLQIERGMGWWYRAFMREQSQSDRQLYETAENSAKAAKRGLWLDASPVPPWTFRQSKD